MYLLPANRINCSGTDSLAKSLHKAKQTNVVRTRSTTPNVSNWKLSRTVSRRSCHDSGYVKLQLLEPVLLLALIGCS